MSTVYTRVPAERSMAPTAITDSPAQSEHPSNLLEQAPYFSSPYGAAYLGDSLELLRVLPSSSVNLVVTSPPYALQTQKAYGNEIKENYVPWFLPFAREIFRVLTDDGSFVLNIGGSYNKGIPTQSLYHYKLLIAMVEQINFHLAQEFFWYNPAKLPAPAQYVTVQRNRVKSSVEQVWWLSKTPHPKAQNRNVLREYSPDMIRLNRKKALAAVRPSGHVIRESFANLDAGGSIPSNVIESDRDDDVPSSMMKMGNNAANDAYTLRCKAEGLKIHPARFPAQLPRFFIKFLTDPDDLVVDPFAGSLTTAFVAEDLERRWLAAETIEQYLDACTLRFGNRGRNRRPM